MMADKLEFHWADYVVLGGFLFLYSLMGLLFGLRNRGAKDAKELLTGGGDMPVLPVGFSMMASFLSAVYVLSMPVEFYTYGTTYAWIIVAYFAGFFIAARYYLPIFYNLKITSAYEYLEMRYNSSIRRLCSALFGFWMSVYMAVVLYAPALALTQVSGMPQEVAILIVGGVVTFYTALGGMKATIWTDALQMVTLLGTSFVIIFLGADRVGGFGFVFDKAQEGGRLRFNEFNPDPLIRTTFWTQCIGGTFMNLTLYCSSQTAIQKFISCKSVKHGQWAVWLSSFLTSAYIVMVVFIGLIVYAFYWDCDPIINGVVEKKDQITPYFMLDMFGDLPGFPGLFIATAFSATLSTVSGGVNALAAITLEDFIMPVYKYKYDTALPITLGKNLTRILAVIFGLVTIGLAFCAEYMGELVLQAALSIFGMVGSPIAGIITLGIFFPKANSTGGFVGMMISLCITCWIGVAAIIEDIALPALPISTEGCEVDFNSTIPPMIFVSIENSVEESSAEYLKIYELSYMYYSIMAMGLVILIGIPVSYLTGGNKRLPEQSSMLFYNVGAKCCCCCSPSAQDACNCGVDHDDDEDGVTDDHIKAYDLENFKIHDLKDTPSDDQMPNQCEELDTYVIHPNSQKDMYRSSDGVYKTNSSRPSLIVNAANLQEDHERNGCINQGSNKDHLNSSAGRRANYHHNWAYESDTTDTHL